MVCFKRLIFVAMVMFSSNGYTEEKLVDPTRPDRYKATMNNTPSAQKTERAHYDWVLDSTLISPWKKIAIINGKQVMVDEEINGATVKKIDHQRVTLSYQSETITLLLHQSFISKIKTDAIRN